ncbi:hypothetical protein ACU4GA_09005 [Methylobacterium oryzae CBMB20]
MAELVGVEGRYLLMGIMKFDVGLKPTRCERPGIPAGVYPDREVLMWLALLNPTKASHWGRMQTWFPHETTRAEAEASSASRKALNKLYK